MSEWDNEAGQDYIGVIGVSRAVRGESADGPVGSEAWECMKSQGRKGVDHFSIFIFWLSLEHLYQYTFQGERDGSRPLLAPAFISEVLGIVKSDSRDK